MKRTVVNYLPAAVRLKYPQCEIPIDISKTKGRSLLRIINIVNNHTYQFHYEEVQKVNIIKITGTRTWNTQSPSISERPVIHQWGGINVLIKESTPTPIW